MDAPTILGRLRALGIYKSVPERYHAEIKATLMRHCSSGRTEMWWEPFLEFAHQMRFSHDKDSVPFRALPVRVASIGDVAERVIPIEDFARAHDFQLTGITDSGGTVLGASDPIEGDADLGVGWSCRGAKGVLPLVVRYGLVDAPELAAEINTVLRQRKMPLRVLLLPANGEVWGVVWVDATTAPRAAQWGRVDYVGGLEPGSAVSADYSAPKLASKAPARAAPQLQLNRTHFLAVLLLVVLGIVYWGSTLLEGGTEFDAVELPEVEQEAAVDTAFVPAE